MKEFWSNLKRALQGGAGGSGTPPVPPENEPETARVAGDPPLTGEDAGAPPPAQGDAPSTGEPLPETDPAAVLEEQPDGAPEEHTASGQQEAAPEDPYASVFVGGRPAAKPGSGQSPLQKLKLRWQSLTEWDRMFYKITTPLVVLLLLCFALIPVIRADQPEAAPAMAQAEAEDPVTQPFGVDDSRFLRTGEVDLLGVEGLSRSQLQDRITVTPDVTWGVYGSGVLYIAEHENREYTLTLHDYDAGTSQKAVVNADPFTVTLASASRNLGVSNVIQLKFSHPVSTSAAEQYISLYGVDYDLTVSGRTVTLIPYEPLEYEEEYTVTVSGDMRSQGGKSLYNGRSFTVSTQSRSFKVSLTNPQAQLLPVNHPLVMEFETANTYGSRTPITLSVYRFESLQQYADQSHIFTDYDQLVDLDLLERVDTQLDLLPSQLHQLEVALPGAGAYIVEAFVPHPAPDAADAVDYSFRKAVFVTDLSLYLQTNRDETLAWLNHSGTGEALGGYRVEFASATKADAAVSLTTDAQGIGTLRYSGSYEENSPEVVRIYDGEDQLVYIDNTRVLNQYYSSAGDLYYSFFYADRAIYQPTDEISFWGYVRSYQGNDAPTPSTLEVIFDAGGLDITTLVSVDAYGTFHGTIELEQVKSSQYAIQVRIPREEDEEREFDPYYDDYYYYDSGVLDRLWVDVKDYVKPTFVLSSTTDKLFYRWDEMVTVSVTPTFYDGTPLPHYDLEFSVFSGYYGSQGAVQIITTDETGVATVSFPAYQMEGDAVWNPVQNRYRARIASDGEDIIHNGSYYYFPSDTMLVGSIAGSSNPALTINVNELTLAAITGEESFYDLYPGSGTYMADRHGVLRGAAKDARVEVEVTYHCYNLIGNWVERTYTTRVSTVDGVARLEDLISETWRDQYYASVYATLSVEDGNGNTVSYYCSWYNPNSRYYYGGESESTKVYPPGYSLAVVDADGASMTGDYYEYYPYLSVRAGDGESMTFSLLLDGEPVANTGRLLYTVNQNDVVSQGLVTADQFTLNQRVDWAQSVILVAAYFDGTEVHTVFDTYIDFDLASVKVDLEVTADKSVYRPGDSVTLTLRATDQNGNGVAGNALLSVVDEAVFALKEQYISLVGDLYGNMYFYNNYTRKYTTTGGDYNFREGMDGGKGDGDGLAFYDSYRKDFKDTAAFLPVRTNAGGQATVTFTLPDNTTSWRITSLAIGDNLYGGQQTDNIISTLPFFISPVVSTKYIEGDDLAMLVQAHGTLLEADMEIEYTVRLFGDEFDETREIAGVAFQPNQLNFGKLPVGEYTLVATARYSGYSDTVELPIAVISSNLELVINRELDLSEPFQLSAMRYPVVISFYDRENEPFFRSVSSLLTHYCFRADQRMSRFVAKRALGEFMDPDTIPQYIRDSGDSVAEYQNWDGGIAWYEGGESDPLLTVKMLLIAPDQFNHNLLAEYLYDIVKNSPDGGERASAYMGLAYLGQPVVDDIQELLDSGSLRMVERVRLIGALALAGETDQALALYQSTVTPRLTDGARSGRYVQINPLTASLPRSNEFRRLEDEITAAAWITASYLDLDDADQFALYFADDGWRINSLFECMIYVSWYSKEIPPRTFTYSVGGVDHTVNLGTSGQRSIRFTKSELEGLSLEGVPENLTAIAYYIGEPSEVDFQPSENFTIEKTVEEIQPGRYAIEMTIRFGDDAPTGYYDISEWVPSNMRLYSVRSMSGQDNWWGRYWEENQKLYFEVNRRSKQCDEITLRYTAQVTFDAQAVIDSTYIIHGDTGENNMTQRYLLEN